MKDQSLLERTYFEVKITLRRLNYHKMIFPVFCVPTWDHPTQPYRWDHADMVDSVIRGQADYFEIVNTELLYPPNASLLPQGDGLPKAIEILCNALREDKSEGSYYYSWQANIAMAFYDECNRWREKNERENIPATAIHEIANTAAKYFLDLLIAKPKDDINH